MDKTLGRIDVPCTLTPLLVFVIRHRDGRFRDDPRPVTPGARDEPRQVEVPDGAQCFYFCTGVSGTGKTSNGNEFQVQGQADRSPIYYPRGSRIYTLPEIMAEFPDDENLQLQARSCDGQRLVLLPDKKTWVFYFTGGEVQGEPPPKVAVPPPGHPMTM